MRPNRFAILGALLFVSCAQATQLSTPARTTMPTTSPATTSTPVATPEVAHNLSSQNAAQVVMENRMWVTKNAKGQVTATFDNSEQEWEYVYENIKLTYSTVGLEGSGVTLPVEMTRPMPDDPEKHFTLNGKPLPDGFWKEGVMGLVSLQGHKDQPVAFLFARVRGVIETPPTFAISGHEYSRGIVLEIRYSPDVSVFLIHPENLTRDRFVFLYPRDLGRAVDDPANGYSSAEDFEISELLSWLNSDQIVGQQIMIHYRHSFDKDNIYYQTNAEKQDLLNAIKNHNLPDEQAILFGDFNEILGIPEDLFPPE